jgi:hypothetical protein
MLHAYMLKMSTAPARWHAPSRILDWKIKTKRIAVAQRLVK